MQRGLSVAFAERRYSRRFPVELALSHRVLGDRSDQSRGAGTTVNFSGKGLLFASDYLFEAGSNVELALDWPVQLDGRTALRLVVEGRVVRCDGGRAAVRILRYEFRTRIARALG
jgi:hypothetical protein